MYPILPTSTGLHGRLAALQPLVESNGEYDKLVDGAFENFLSIKGQSAYDPHFTKVVARNLLSWQC
jgi:hypothetical protein